MKNKNISCIIPCYNCEKYISKTLDHILSQTIMPLEVILINDASTDNTLEVLCDLSRHYKGMLKILDFKTNKGTAYARNCGVRNAKGDYILFMDSDDIAETTLIEKYINRLKILNSEMKGKYILCYSSYFQIDENDEIISGISKGFQVEPEEILGYEFIRNHIATSGVLVEKESFLKVGGFNESLKYSEDWDLWLRLAAIGGFAYVDEPLVKVRRHRANTSSNINNMINGEKKVLEQYDISYIRDAIYKRKLSFEQNITDFVSILFRIGCWEEGFEELNNLVENGYNFYNIYFYLGIYYLNKRELDKAIENFEKVVEQKKNHGAALNNIGGIYLLKRKYETARMFLQNALNYFPNYIDAISNLKLLDNQNISFEKVRFTYRELRSVLLNYNN